MNEKPTLEIIAPTVEEALAQGLAQLGLPAEAVSMEVLDAGTKGLFGLGGRQVRVRLTVKNGEEESPAEKAPAEHQPSGPPAVNEHPGEGSQKPHFQTSQRGGKRDLGIAPVEFVDYRFENSRKSKENNPGSIEIYYQASA